ncbi:hypothetical protein VF21_10276 [Pseudogymnoascus sp. 05NY08]|nr:hypothetical protein VF21_10276 [Pseudogymnoascus sp. 05NY08]
MNNRNWVREAQIKMGMKWLLANEEYQKVICTRKQCRIGLELGGVEKHLIKTHRVRETLVGGIQMGICAQEGKGWDECSKKRLRNGLKPQKGLAVFDGFQCRFCEEPPARTVEEVNDHLYEMHRETEGHIWDKVPVQSWGGKGGVKDECWIVDDSKQSEEKKAEDETMGDNGGQIILREEAILASSIVVNEEFRRMICKECKLAVGLGMVGKHLLTRHSVKRDMAQQIAKLIDMGEWGCVEGKGKKAKKPENGTRPQKWLMVFNMLQCTFCREFHARSVDEVESHWHRAGHGKAEGAMIKPVRMQSWGGWNGWGLVKDKDFWVVEEGLGGDSRDGQIGAEDKEDCKDGKYCGNGEGVEEERQGEQHGKGEEEVEWEVIQEF